MPSTSPSSRPVPQPVPQQVPQPVPQPVRRPVRRPVLRPGVHVLRRSATEIQVGLDPGRAVVLPASDGARGTLEALARPGAPHGVHGCDEPTLAQLGDADLLVDHDVLLPLVSPGTSAGLGQPARPGAAAVAAWAGDDVTEILDRRAARPVEVHAAGAEAARRVATQLAHLLTEAGCRAAEVDAETHSDPAEPPVMVLVVVGEPARELVDGWLRDGIPHALLRLTEGRLVLGPFVVPGATACLRCVDAHHTDIDPVWPLLVTQYAAATRLARDDALPEPVDPLIASLGAAWMARDVVTFLEGRSPSTASTTLRLDAHLGALETETWARHPGCGCTWGEKSPQSWTCS